MTNPTEYVPVRLRQDQLAAMDEVLKKLGGSRSEFVRMAVDERLKHIALAISALNGGGATPAPDYHDQAALSMVGEFEDATMTDTTPPSKSTLVVEARRDQYAATFVLRNRRSWAKMSVEERVNVLLHGAMTLEWYASQMREEAEQLQMPA